MKYFLLSICLIAATAFCQKTKKVVVENEVPEFKEVFYVLVDSPAVRHGDYKRTFGGRHKVEEKGQYDHGKKTGVWSFDGFDGTVEQKIDFSNQQILSTKPFKMLTSSFAMKAGRWVENTSETLPLFLGGVGRATSIFLMHLRYPATARRLGVQGSVFVSGIVTKDGRLVDEQIEQGLGYGLDEESVRIIRMLPDEWLPVGWGSEPQESKVVLEIKYRLN
ncbi:MAG: energy transducer TonB [Bacteroidota bacterium]|nr:energy transducer TonB [Bacteroidota bacterium]